MRTADDESAVTVAEPSTGDATVEHTLALYVKQGCVACAAARELAIRAEREFQGLAVRVIDLSVSSEQVPEGVFAAPTFVLDDRIVSLGTPSWGRLCEAVDEIFGGRDNSTPWQPQRAP